MPKFLHDNDTKAIAIPRVFSENSRAKNLCISWHCVEAKERGRVDLYGAKRVEQKFY